MNVGSVHQIEITSRCNLRCRYCVHPTMARSKEDMSPKTFARALAWVSLFVENGTQGQELNLCGIGESTLHPLFCTFVKVARDALGQERDLVMATNGVGVTEEHAQAMAAARMRVWVSLHRPEKAGPTIELLKKHGVLAGVSADPAIASVDWAGQVAWHVSAPTKLPCPWLRDRKVMIAADGSVLTCSFDGSGAGKLGTVWGSVEAMRVAPYSLCEGCHQAVPP